MANLYHYTALRGAELCSGQHGKCTMASAADHYTSWAAADAQKVATLPRKKGSKEHTLPEQFTWRLVKAMAMVFADEIVVKKESGDTIYTLKSGDVPYQKPFEQLRSEKYCEATPRKEGESHHRLMPTIRGMMRVQDARILGALHSWAAARGVDFTPLEAQELINGYRAKTPVVFSAVLSRSIIAAASMDFFTELRGAATNLLRLETIALAPASDPDFIDPSQYVVVETTNRVASVTPVIASSGFIVEWRASIGGPHARSWSFEVATPQAALERYLTWALEHPLTLTSPL